MPGSRVRGEIGYLKPWQISFFARKYGSEWERLIPLIGNFAYLFEAFFKGLVLGITSSLENAGRHISRSAFGFDVTEKALQQNCKER